MICGFAKRAKPKPSAVWNNLTKRSPTPIRRLLRHSIPRNDSHSEIMFNPLLRLIYFLHSCSFVEGKIYQAERKFGLQMKLCGDWDENPKNISPSCSFIGDKNCQAERSSARTLKNS
jgi:hypothetical protein